MHHQRPPATRRWIAYLAFIISLFTASCDRQSPSPLATQGSDQPLHFTGTWTATGNRQIMQLGSGHEAWIFSYSGSLLLKGEQRLNVGFRGEVIGFVDSLTGMQGRVVWTDERGEKVFSDLQAEANNPGQLIKGRFIGGTGRYTGVVGEYTFKWQRLTDAGYGKVSGRVVDLKGWARLDAHGNSQTNSRGLQ